MLKQVYAQVNTTINASAQFGSDWTLTNFFAFTLNLVLAVGMSLTLIMLAMGFIKYIMSQGDKAGVEQAQKWVTYAVIGGLGIFLVFALRSAVMKALNTQGFTPGTNVNI